MQLGSIAPAGWPAATISLGAILVIGIPHMIVGRTLDPFEFGDTSVAWVGVGVTLCRWLIVIATALMTGAISLIWRDTAGRSLIDPQELPLNIVMAFALTPVAIASLVQVPKSD